MITLKDLKDIEFYKNSNDGDEIQKRISLEIVEWEKDIEDKVLTTIGYEELDRNKAEETFGDYRVMELKAESKEDTEQFLRVVIMKGNENE